MADRSGDDGSGGGRRRVPWYVGLPVTLAVIAAVFVAAGHFGWLPGLPDPFGERTVDRSGSGSLAICGMAVYATWTPFGSSAVNDGGSLRSSSFWSTDAPIVTPHVCDD